MRFQLLWAISSDHSYKIISPHNGRWWGIRSMVWPRRIGTVIEHGKYSKTSVLSRQCGAKLGVSVTYAPINVKPHYIPHLGNWWGGLMPINWPRCGVSNFVGCQILSFSIACLRRWEFYILYCQPITLPLGGVLLIGAFEMTVTEEHEFCV